MRYRRAKIQGGTYFLRLLLTAGGASCVTRKMSTYCEMRFDT